MTMGLENCQITLDNAYATYYPGQVVSGTAELNFNSKKKVCGIEVEFKGIAQTHWSESKIRHGRQRNRSHRKRVSYLGNEEYFNVRHYIIGGPTNDAIELHAGRHVYKFSYVLPPVLPASFEGDLGYIRYSVKVTLVRPWKFNQEIKTLFTVISNFDLNVMPLCREPSTLTLEKYFHFLLAKSGPLTCLVKLPQTGFVPGQTVSITMDINNATKKRLTKIKLQLQQQITYYSQTPRPNKKSSEMLVKEIVDNDEIAGNSSVTICKSLTIPPVAPSNLTNCTIIDLSYTLSVTLELDRMRRDIQGNVPVIIGTIPLRQLMPSTHFQPQINHNHHHQQQQQSSMMGWTPAPVPNALIESTITPSAPDLSTILPPSYEESQFGTKSILEKDESPNTIVNTPNWAPSYPVYHFNDTKPSESIIATSSSHNLQGIVVNSSFSTKPKT